MRDRRDDCASRTLTTRRPPTPVDEDVDRTSIDVGHVFDTRMTLRHDAWRVANRHDLDKMFQFGDASTWSKPRSRPLVPRASFVSFSRATRSFSCAITAQWRREGTELHTENQNDPCTRNFFGTYQKFLVRTKNFWYNTVCPYKMPDTVVHWYSTRAVPGRPGLATTGSH